MSSERRSLSRCPVCGGPALNDERHVDGIRCRNSSCKHNHANVECPRCHAKEIGQAIWRDHKWSYTCNDCEYVWAK